MRLENVALLKERFKNGDLSMSERGLSITYYDVLYNLTYKKSCLQ